MQESAPVQLARRQLLGERQLLLPRQCKRQFSLGIGTTKAAISNVGWML